MRGGGMCMLVNLKTSKSHTWHEQTAASLTTHVHGSA